MHGVGAGAARRLEQAGNRQVLSAAGAGPIATARSAARDVPRLCVNLRVHRDALDSELAAGADDPHGDLAAVGYEEALDLCDAYSTQRTQRYK
jgi:hypothetical protein